MDFSKRLEELNAKLEQGDLSETEQAEIELIYSYTLLAVRDLGKEIKALMDKLDVTGV